MIDLFMNRVLVTLDTPETKTASGLELPSGVVLGPRKATVVRTGNGYVRNGEVIPLSVKKGDRVILKPHTGSPIEIDGVEALLCWEHDILGLFTE
jgi:chaperonin GroES